MTARASRGGRARAHLRSRRAPQAVQTLQQSASAIIDELLCTDAPFLYAPQQIALAALQRVPEGSAAPSALNVEDWLRARFKFLPDGADEKLMRQLRAIQEERAAGAAGRKSNKELAALEKRRLAVHAAVTPIDRARERQADAARREEKEAKAATKARQCGDAQQRLTGMMEAALAGAPAAADGEPFVVARPKRQRK